MNKTHWLLIVLSILLLWNVYEVYNIEPCNEHIEHSTKGIDTFTISGGTFPSDVRVLITEDTTFALKYIQRYDSTIKAENLRGAAAETFCLNGDEVPLIWLKYVDMDDYSSIGSVYHEVFHVTSEILRYHGVQLDDSTDDVYAYEVEYFSNQIYQNVKGLR